MFSKDLYYGHTKKKQGLFGKGLSVVVDFDSNDIIDANSSWSFK